MNGRINAAAVAVVAALTLAALGACGADQPVTGKVVDKQIEHDGTVLEHELVVETAAGERHVFAVEPDDWRRFQVGLDVTSADFDQPADD